MDDSHTKWRNTDAITAAFYHYFSIKTFPVHPSNIPWMIPPQKKRFICQRNRPFYFDLALYKKVRNTVIREIKATKATFYPDKIQHLKQANNRQWYSKIKALCGLDKPSPSLPCTSHFSPSLAAEEINSHFATICQILPSFEPALLPAYLSYPSPSPIAQDADVTKIRKFKLNTSTTPTNFSVKKI